MKPILLLIPLLLTFLAGNAKASPYTSVQEEQLKRILQDKRYNLSVKTTENTESLWDEIWQYIKDLLPEAPELPEVEKSPDMGWIEDTINFLTSLSEYLLFIFQMVTVAAVLYALYRLTGILLPHLKRSHTEVYTGKLATVKRVSKKDIINAESAVQKLKLLRQLIRQNLTTEQKLPMSLTDRELSRHLDKEKFKTELSTFKLHEKAVYAEQPISSARVDQLAGSYSGE